MENQSEYHIRDIPAIKRATSGHKFVVKVARERLEEAERTWELDRPAQRAQGVAGGGRARSGDRAAVRFAFVILYIVFGEGLNILNC